MLDPTLGDSTAGRLREQLARGEWREAQRFLQATRNWDDRAFYVGVLAEWEGRPAWLSAWHAESGARSPVSALLRGAHSINWAWEARGGATADKVESASWPLFVERLQSAERDLELAAASDPEDPTPWAYLILSGIGLQVGPVILRQRFEEARRRHREGRLAHRGLLSGLAWKWGGSHDEMFAFARETSEKAPPGSTLHVLPALAHVERWLAFRMEDDESGMTGYLGRPEVRSEIFAAWSRLFAAPRLRSPRFEAADRNVFAFLFWQAREFDRGHGELLSIGSQVTEQPWAYLGDALAVADRARAACAGSADPALAERMWKLREEAVRSARETSRVELDYSEASLLDVDRILAGIHQALPQERDENRRTKAAGMLAGMYGAYVGEVVRRQRGGLWVEKVPGAENAGMGLGVGGRYGFPVLQCARLLKKGPSESVAAYVREWLAPPPATDAGTATTSSPAMAPPGEATAAVSPSAGSPPGTSSPAQAMANFARGAVADVGSILKDTLDYTEKTLPVVDRMLDLVRKLAETQPLEEKRATFNVSALKYGAYVGEVLRRERGAVWRDDAPGQPKELPALSLGRDIALTVPAILGLLLDRAVSMEKGSVTTVVGYYNELAERQQRWLEELLIGKEPDRDALLAAMADDRALAETLFGLAGSALVTAWAKWDLHLDFSEASVLGLENLLALLHENLREQRPTEDQIRGMAMIWGAYLGEVLRRHLGGRWLNSEIPPQGRVLRLVIGSAETYPLRQVEKRILEGAGDNVHFYYHATAKIVRGKVRL